MVVQAPAPARLIEGGLPTEVTVAQRIRDKIASSKKLSMWMGGRTLIGYDVRDRKLVVNEQEAGPSDTSSGANWTSGRASPG